MASFMALVSGWKSVEMTKMVVDFLPRHKTSGRGFLQRSPSSRTNYSCGQGLGNKDIYWTSLMVSNVGFVIGLHADNHKRSIRLDHSAKSKVKPFIRIA